MDNYNLKIYIQDHSWRGCIVVVASSECEARKRMNGEYNYEPDKALEEYPINDEFIFTNLGDS